jgi:hypothetical protein
VAIFGSACAVDNPSCEGIGYPSWSFPIGNTCVFDKNGDIVCCPNGMVCDDSLPYLGPSSSVSASQQTIHVTHTSPPNLPPSSVAGATVSSSSAKDPTIIAGPIRMGGLTAGPTATARGPSTVVIYSEGNSGRMVGVYHLIAVSFWSSAFLL